MLARLDELGEQTDQVVGILGAKEAVRPERQRLGPDTNGLDMIEFGLQQGFEVITQVTRLHHHRIATGEQQVGHLRVATQIVVQRLGL